MTDLGDFYQDQNQYQSLGINAQGSVVGATARWGQPYQGFLYSPGKFTQLPNLGYFADPRQVNARGQIAGGASLADGSVHPVLWDKGAITELPTLGGPNGFAVALNDTGDAAGNSSFRAPYDYRAAAWIKGRASDLSIPGFGTHAYLWRSAQEGMIDLNSTTPSDSAVTLFNTTSINGAEQITAPGYVTVTCMPSC